MNRFPVVIRTLALLCALALFVAACGDDDDDDPGGDDTGQVDSGDSDSNSDSDGDGDESGDGGDGDAMDDDDAMDEGDAMDDGEAMDDTDTEEVRGTIEASFVGTPIQATGEALTDGEVKVYFNNGSNGTLVAIYHGEGLSDPTGLCPGNSINTGAFEFVSNAPASEGACEGFPTEVGSVRVCTGNVWLYETKIPNDTVGTLYASLEGRNADGDIIGHYGTAENKTATPEVDVAATVYDIDAMFPTDGSSEITCSAALT